MEFALVFPVFILLLFGILDLGRAVYAYNTIGDAAREGARVAIVNQIQTSPDCLQDRPIQDLANPHWSIKACAVRWANALDVTPSDVTVSYAAPPGIPLTCSPTVSVGCIASRQGRLHLAPDHADHRRPCRKHRDVLDLPGPRRTGLPMNLNLTNRSAGARHVDRMNKGRETQRGQIIVMMAGAMVAVILVVALIVDGGNAWAQRRIVQNGSDAMAQAGAIVMAQRFAGVPAPVGGWDAEVNAKIQASAAANNVANAVAYYTDICGIPLKADGTAALHGDGTEDLASAVQVGSGALPGGTATTPDCPTAHVGPVAGVMVTGIFL